MSNVKKIETNIERKVKHKLNKEAKQVDLFDIFQHIGIIGFAVGSVVGTATSDLVKSLSVTVIMPVLQYLFGSNNWKSYAFNLGNKGSKVLIGQFMSQLIYFLVIFMIISFVISIILKSTVARQIKNSQKNDELKLKYQSNILSQLEKLNKKLVTPHPLVTV